MTRVFIKRIIEKTPIFHPLRDIVIKRRQRKEIDCWEHNGKPLPVPHMIKQEILRSYSKAFGLKIFIETGTYQGDMVEALRNDFTAVYSIEICREFFERARCRFEKYDHIRLVHGDSGAEMRNVLSMVDEPALFWLDGHYSGGETARGEKETPVLEELAHILVHREKRHVILIDDARNFTGVDYPTMEEVVELLQTGENDYRLEIEDDIIRITPGSRQTTTGSLLRT